MNTAQPQSGLAKSKPTIQQLLESRKDSMASVLPKHLTPERLIRVALVAIGKTPALEKCSQTSLLASIMTAAQLGLDVGGALGHAYLVPYGDKAELILGYRGMIDLARRSGEIISIEARVVWKNDDFDIEYSLDGAKLIHRPALDKDPGDFRLVYGVAKLRDGGTQFELMTKAQIDAIRSRSRSKNNGPWVTDYPEMARKTVVKRLFKYLPVSIELADAVDGDERREYGDLVDSVVISPQPSAADLNKRLASKAPNGLPAPKAPPTVAVEPVDPVVEPTEDITPTDIVDPADSGGEPASEPTNPESDSPDAISDADKVSIWMDEASESFQSFAQGMIQLAIDSTVPTAQAKSVVDALKLTGLSSAKSSAKSARRQVLEAARIGKFNWKTGVVITD